MSDFTVSAAGIKSFASDVGSVDFAKLYELGDKLKEQALLEEFKATPEAVAAREVGLTLPDGIHLHFFDAAAYYPFIGYADGSDDGSAWGSAEVRVGGGGGDMPKWCIAVRGVHV